jgi:alpha 1,2-mannosyltransferase
MTLLWKKALEETPEYPQNVFEGQGIVIAAGGEYYLVNALINLKILRLKGCTLPVEIWYIGEKEVVPLLMEKLEALGAECYDITNHFDYPIKGYEVKPHAILASKFKEVMLIDADNIVLRDPSYLFQREEYQTKGACFWPDQMIMNKDSILWNVLELPPCDFRGQESGQLLVDKERCWKALHLAAHMNKESDFYYKHMLGDKDTFFLSFMVTKTPYHMIDYLPGLVFENKSPLCCIGFLQRDLDGKPLFCHATNMNWSDRKTLKPIWNFYNLTDKRFSDLNYPFPWSDIPYLTFKSSFGPLEYRCLALLKKIQEDLSHGKSTVH